MHCETLRPIHHGIEMVSTHLLATAEPTSNARSTNLIIKRLIICANECANSDCNLFAFHTQFIYIYISTVSLSSANIDAR